MPPPYRAIFFDFGGTLFSYREIALGSRGLVSEAARRLGADAPPEALGAAFREASGEAWSGLLDQAYYLHRDVFLATYRGFAQRLGADPTDAFLGWLYAAQRDMLLERFELRADCLKTLRALRESGHTLSIVSNIDDDYLHPMVERVQLHEVLHHWTSSEEARSCKPDPGFFHYALEKAGCRAEEVLFVGDSTDHDVAGARRVGMTTVLIREADGGPPPGSAPTPSAEPHHVIRELAELLPLVEA